MAYGLKACSCHPLILKFLFFWFTDYGGATEWWRDGVPVSAQRRPC